MPRNGMRNESIDEISRFLIHSICNEFGIAVMEHFDVDMNEQLAPLSLEQAKLAKRRFRKLWRIEYKKEVNVLKERFQSSAPNYTSLSMPTAIKRVTKRYGVGMKNPTRSQRATRKSAVLAAIYQTVEATKNRLTKD